MSFFKYVTDWAQQAIGNADSFQVTEVALPTVRKWDCLANENIFSLYKDRSAFKAVLSGNAPSPKLFLVFKISNQEKAGSAFNALSYKLQVLSSSSVSLNIELVQKISDAIMKYPSYGCAHIAAHLGLHNILAKENVSMSINEVEDSSGKTPLHIAVEEERIDCIQELMFLNVRHDCIDVRGDTAFHYAARCSNPDILKTLASKDSSLINGTNQAGETPLHEACLNDRPENVEMLLRWKADPTLTRSHRQPIHCAVAVGSTRCVETLNKWNVDLIDAKENMFGNSVLHMAEGKEMIHFLFELGCSMEERNFRKETPLLLKIKQGNLPSAIGLLTIGANPSARDEDGNGALHLAIQQDRPDLVQLLVVFGADINFCNNLQVSPRHEAACSAGTNSNEILNLLHMVGAVRCNETKSKCSGGCKFDGNFDGISKADVSPGHKIRSAVEQMFDKSALCAALSRSESLYAVEEAERHRQKPGSRVLCLDGGGIRGLVTIKILMAVEHITGRPIRESFDWIGGTSTGGILTMGLLQGKRLNQIMGAYFRLKDDVFQGRRPYNSESLEKFLKKELGEWMRMTDIQRPRVMLMTVLADRLPAELFIFKNYVVPGIEHDSLPSPFKEFQPIPRPQDQLVWQAVRATGAAPTYFRASGRFIDGGLIANNPTLDVLSEIHKFNTANKAAGNTAEAEPMHVVVSIGTGKAPQRFVKECDVFRPEGILDYTKAFWGAKNFGDLVINQVTQSEGQSVSRAAAWCNMVDVPYYRLNPQLSEDIPLDCTEDSKLINMLWETQCYLQKNHEKLIQLANLLD